jgi:hypothetical protein
VSRLRPLVAGLTFTLLAVGGAAVVTDNPLGAPVRRLLGQVPERLLPPVAADEAEYRYRFTRTQRDTHEPVTFDPCEPVRITYNPQLAPDGSRQLVEEALAEVSRRTGLRLELIGTTDERPSPTRPADDEERYGHGWSPVLLAWSTAGETSGLSGPVVGLGGSIARTAPFSSRLTYVSGSVTLDAEDLGAAMRGPGGRSKVRAIVLHELAHLVGLDHVDDANELMQPENRGRTTFGPGDLAGLARLGAGPCRP